MIYVVNNSLHIMNLNILRLGNRLRKYYRALRGTRLPNQTTDRYVINVEPDM